MACKLVLVRHALSQANLENTTVPQAERIVGEAVAGDRLTDSGRRQARQLGQVLQPLSRSPRRMVVACSQAERAKETCALSLPGTSYVVSETLNELHKGEWEGRAVADIWTPEVRRDLERLHWHYRPPGGESREDACQRALPFVDRLTQDAFDVVILFSHLDLIRCLLTELLELDKKQAYRINIANASLSILEWDGHWQSDCEYLAPGEGGYVQSRFPGEDGVFVQEA